MSWLRCCLAPLILLAVCCSQDYNMPQCRNGILQIWETHPQTPIRCNGLTYYDNMYWMITPNRTFQQIAFCEDGYSSYKCSVYDADFSAWRNRTVSQLVMENYVRDKVVNKTLICVRRDGAREDSCRIRAVYPAEITNRSVTLSGWTVTATVVIDKVYDSDKDVFCFWEMTGPNAIYVRDIDRPQFFAFVESGRIYYSGSCSLSHPLNVTEGVYHVTVTVVPAGETVAVGNVTLKKPGTLLRLPACPQYIAEWSNLECPCRHALEGSPRARVTWLNHDVTPVLPTNHADTSVLRVSNVRREQNGTTYTCRSVWGPNDDVTQSHDYTLRVAYGPSSASVISQANVTDDTHLVTLTCSAHDVYPSANFTWSVPCLTLTLNLTSPISTCTLAQEAMKNATEVVCLAVNTEVPVNARGVYTAPGLNKLHDEGSSADGALGLVVGGSITAVVVIAALVVVVIIVVFRRKGSSKPASAKNSDEFEEYINGIYESTDDVEPTNLQRQNLSENNAAHPPQSSTPHHNSEENTTRKDATCSINTAMAKANPSPRNDVYAEVVKKPKDATPKTNPKKTQPIPDETYAEVQKKSKGENSPTQAKSPEVVKKPKSARPKTKSKETKHISDETYAQVQKRPKGENSPTQAKSREVVKKPKSATPKTKSKEIQAVPDETYAEVQKRPKGEHLRGHAKSSVKKIRKEDDRKSETSTGQDVTAKRMSKREEVTEYANCPPESTGENSEDVYMNVGQSSPLTLTESNTEVTKEAATDDEYNGLSFARPQTWGTEDHYNHLDRL